jgi:hypothetical protein
MSNTLVFKNKLVQDLYDHVNSSQVANLDHVDHITTSLLPYINAVITDPEAYIEAKTWSEFYGVSSHIDDGGKKACGRLDNNASMCFSLWMYIYH